MRQLHVLWTKQHLFKGGFDRVLYPLFQVKDRTCVLITTPPPVDGFFQAVIKLVKEANSKGDNWFYLQNDSLCCDECLKNKIPDRCTHNLSFLPPWKSLIRLRHSMSKLVDPREMATFRQEVLGILGDDKSSYFSPELVDGVFKSHRVKTPKFEEIYVAIDPASHNSSSMGICAIGVQDGTIYLMGLASVRLERADVLQSKHTF